MKSIHNLMNVLKLNTAGYHLHASLGMQDDSVYCVPQMVT